MLPVISIHQIRANLSLMWHTKRRSSNIKKTLSFTLNCSLSSHFFGLWMDFQGSAKSRDLVGNIFLSSLAWNTAEIASPGGVYLVWRVFAYIVGVYKETMILRITLPWWWHCKKSSLSLASSLSIVTKPNSQYFSVDVKTMFSYNARRQSHLQPETSLTIGTNEHNEFLQLLCS